MSSDTLLTVASYISSSYLGTRSSFLNEPEVAQSTLIEVSAVIISIFSAHSLYEAGEKRRDYWNLVKAISLSIALLLLIGHLHGLEQRFFFKHLFLFWLLSTPSVCIGRLLIDWVTELLRMRGWLCYPVVIIADDSCIEQATRIVNEEKRYKVEAVLTPSALDLEKRESTFERMRELGIAEAYVSWDAVKNRMFLGSYFKALGVTLNVIPAEQGKMFGGTNLHMLNDYVPCITFYPQVVSGTGFWLKQVFDISFSFLFLALASPLYLAIALAIWLESPGHIFYKQVRIGLHGEPFEMWKFRSMVQDADCLQADLEAMNSTKDGVLFKIKEDPRITRVGKIIRRYSLDELPQLFNVILGEMSLIGPRPLPLRDVGKFEQRHFIRQDVLPGVTGLWQVSGRSDIDNFDDVLKLDLYYIQNWSLLLDARILFKTLGAVFKKAGAY